MARRRIFRSIPAGWLTVALLFFAVGTAWSNPATGDAAAADATTQTRPTNSQPGVPSRSQPSRYKLAIEAFRRADYQQAVELFQQAAATGQRDGRLFYNLGVSQYRLQNYAAARRAFKKAAKDSETQQLAWYNLGLANWRLQQLQAAQYWFQRVLEEGDDAALKKLAKKARKRLAFSKDMQQGKRLSGVASFGFGYDQNPLNQSQEMLGVQNSQVEGGGFLLHNSFFQWQLHRDRKSSEKVGVSYLIEEFAGDSQSDFFVVDGHYRLYWRDGAHSRQLGLNTAASFIGGSRAQQTGSLRLQYGYLTDYGQFSLRYRLTGYRGLKPVFSSQDGHRHQLGLGWFKSAPSWGLRLLANYQENTRASEFASPRRRELIAGAFWRPAWRWKLDLENGWRDSRYPSTVERRERRWQQQLRVEYRMSAHWWLKSRARHVENIGEPSNFAYRRKRIDFGIDYRF